MKKIFTSKILLICAFIFSTYSIQAQILPWLFNFLSTPIRISGYNNAVNSKYRFPGVKPGTDAIVTIVSATGGASVRILDDNSTAMPEAFSPNIKIKKNSTGVVEFKIEYVLTGTLLPLVQDSLYATAIDIDGSSDLHEIDAIDLYGGAVNFLVANPEISVVQSGTMFTATNVAGIEYAGIDTAAKQVMFTVRHSGVSSFIYKCGAVNNTNSDIERQKSMYFKDFLYPAGGTLPVKYLSFEAVVNDKSVLLKWLTVQEMNNSHFEVQRSFDMNTYNTIGLVLDGFSTSGTGKSYQYKDNSTELQGRSIVYYRLKQIDIDGKVTYSKVLAVRLQAKADVLMQVSPNPFMENVNVRFNATENSTAVIRISNLAGQTMLSKQAIISKGYNNIQVDGLNRLASGMYMAQLIVNGTVIDNQKLIKN
jgi:hypothetical protein